MGCVSRTDVETFGEAERLNLVFIDGVTSAPTTTDLSGRGVGMSAVKSQVERCDGTVQMYSDAGQGTRVSLFVPKPSSIEWTDSVGP